MLLVENDPTVLEAIGHALHEQGCDVLLARDALHAIKRIVAERIDALVVDMDLPDEEAAPLAEFARSREPNLPVLLMTSSSEARERRRVRLDPPPIVVAKSALLDALSRGFDALG